MEQALTTGLSYHELGDDAEAISIGSPKEFDQSHNGKGKELPW